MRRQISLRKLLESLLLTLDVPALCGDIELIRMCGHVGGLLIGRPIRHIRNDIRIINTGGMKVCLLCHMSKRRIQCLRWRYVQYRAKC